MKIVTEKSFLLHKYNISDLAKWNLWVSFFVAEYFIQFITKRNIKNQHVIIIVDIYFFPVEVSSRSISEDGRQLYYSRTVLGNV